MLKLSKISVNSAELTIGNYTILFSYETAVALYNHTTQKYNVVEGKWTKTTNKHIDTFLHNQTVDKVITSIDIKKLF